MAFPGGTFTLKKSPNLITGCIPEALDLLGDVTLLGVSQKNVIDPLCQKMHIHNKICTNFRIFSHPLKLNKSLT